MFLLVVRPINPLSFLFLFPLTSIKISWHLSSIGNFVQDKKRKTAINGLLVFNESRYIVCLWQLLRLRSFSPPHLSSRFPKPYPFITPSFKIIPILLLVFLPPTSPFLYSSFLFLLLSLPRGVHVLYNTSSLVLYCTYTLKRS